MKTIALVRPFYNEGEMVLEFFAQLLPIVDSLKQYSFELICIDDGSSDNTLINLCNINDRRLKIIQFSRNFHKEAAIFIKFTSKRAVFHYKKIKHALRCNIARHLTGESYRLFSIRLADSELFHWFTGINAFGCRKAISKSSLERYEKILSEEIRRWLADLTDDNKAVSAGIYGLIDCKTVFTDTTCIKAL